jgi:hypothetical protein
MTTDDERLDALIRARTAGAARLRAAELTQALARLAPAERVTAAAARVAATAGARPPWPVFGLRTAVPWPRLVDRVLPGLGLGVAPDDARAHGRLVDRDAWAAAIVARAHGLWTAGPPPTLAALCDALVWRGLGLAGTPKRSPPEIRAVFATKLTGETGAHDRQIRIAAAAAVGAARTELRLLRDALARRWLAGAPLGAATPARTEPPAAVDLPALADAVTAAARTATDGVFGERKVFISAVWHRLAASPAAAGLDLARFKQHLIDAHRAGLVALVRADLVGAMDPALVAASETADGDARFHFVIREPSQGAP